MSKNGESFLGFFWRSPFLIKLRLLAVGLFGGGVLVCSTWAVYQLLKVQKLNSPAPAAHAPAGHHDVASVPPAPEYTFNYELKDVSLPLLSRVKKKTYYAQFTLVFDLVDEETKRWWEVNRPQIADVMLEVGHRFRYEDFRDPKGYDKFKKQLKVEYKKAFKNFAPRDVVIKDWILN